MLLNERLGIKTFILFYLENGLVIPNGKLRSTKD
jgi:hypothetical protein